MPFNTEINILVVDDMRPMRKLVKSTLLMITAEREMQNVMLAIKNGVSCYILKPLIMQAMLEKPEKILT